MRPDYLQIWRDFSIAARWWWLQQLKGRDSDSAAELDRAGQWWYNRLALYTWWLLIRWHLGRLINIFQLLSWKSRVQILVFNGGQLQSELVMSPVIPRLSRKLLNGLVIYRWCQRNSQRGASSFIPCITSTSAWVQRKEIMPCTLPTGYLDQCPML